MDQVQPKAHGRTREGRRELLLMRLSQSGRSVASATPVTFREERRFRTIEELRRLSTGLPAGKIRVTLGLESEAFSSGLGDVEAGDLKLTGQTANLTVEYGLDSRTELIVSGGVGRGQAILSGPAFGRFDLGSSVTSTPMQIAVSRRVDLGLPENFAVDISAGAFLQSLLKPVAVQSGISTQVQLGRTALVGGVDLAVVRERKRLGIRLAPSLGVGYQLARGWSLSGNVSAVASPKGIEDASLGLSLQTALAKNWFASAYVAQSVYSIDGAAARRIGLSLTYALPNQLR